MILATINFIIARSDALLKAQCVKYGRTSRVFFFIFLVGHLFGRVVPFNKWVEKL